MRFTESKSAWFDDFWIRGIGIPLLGFGMPFIGGLLRQDPILTVLVNSMLSLIGTGFLWLGCRAILHRIMDIFPWHEKPLQHLAADLISIPLYTFLVIQLMWMVSVNIHVIYCCLTDGFWELFLVSMVISLIISFIHEGMYFFFQWKNTLLLSQRLEHENLLSQFETLKSQINPHFLFNSFNTLMTIIDEDKEKAILYVEKMSDFFRVLLQMRDKTTIALQEELELTETYFYLQTRRYGDNIRLHKHLDIGSEQHLVPPLCIQMLVENAIKHNIITTENPLHIYLESEGNHTLHVSNTLQRRNEPATASGMGLENIRKRYEILAKRDVIISESESLFRVSLPLLTPDTYENSDH